MRVRSLRGAHERHGVCGGPANSAEKPLKAASGLRAAMSETARPRCHVTLAAALALVRVRVRVRVRG